MNCQAKMLLGLGVGRGRQAGLPVNSLYMILAFFPQNDLLNLLVILHGFNHYPAIKIAMQPPVLAHKIIEGRIAAAKLCFQCRYLFGSITVCLGIRPELGIVRIPILCYRPDNPLFHRMQKRLLPRLVVQIIANQFQRHFNINALGAT